MCAFQWREFWRNLDSPPKIELRSYVVSFEFDWKRFHAFLITPWLTPKIGNTAPWRPIWLHAHGPDRLRSRDDVDVAEALRTSNAIIYIFLNLETDANLSITCVRRRCLSNPVQRLLSYTCIPWPQRWDWDDSGGYPFSVNRYILIWGHWIFYPTNMVWSLA